MKKQYVNAVAKISAIALIAVAFGFQGVTVYAASLTSITDEVTRLQVSELADHEIKFVTPTGVDQSTDTITLTFGAEFTMGSFALANFDLAEGSSNDCSTASFTDRTLAASAAAGTWGVAQAGQVVTFTAPTDAPTAGITADRCVQIEIGSNATSGGAGSTQITNPSDVDDDDTIAIAGTFGDTGTLELGIVANDTVNVTATVDPQLTFTINDTTIGFGSLKLATGRWATGDTNGGDASATTPTEAHQMGVATNANSGYVLQYEGDLMKNPALDDIDAATVSDDSDGTPGTEQFGLSISTDGDATIPSAYLRDSAASFSYVANTATTIASETGSTSLETFSASYLANISATTPSGEYETDILYTATGTF